MADLNPDSPIIESSDGKSLRELIKPLFRRQALFVVTFLITVIVVIVVGTMIVPLPYKSIMSVLVNKEREEPLVSSESTTQMSGAVPTAVTLEDVNSEAELLVSEDVLRNVVISVGLDRPGTEWYRQFLPVQSKEERIARAVKKLAKKVKVENQTNSNVIQVSYKSSDPELSHAVLVALAKYYVEKHVLVHRPTDSFQFFADETQRYQNAMNDSEAKLRMFSTHENIAAPDVMKPYLAQALATAIGQLSTVQQAISADTDRITGDRALMLKTPQRSTTVQSTSPADKLLEDLTSTLVAAENKRTQLGTKYDVSYPLIKEADQEIMQIKKAIAEAEDAKYVTQSTDVDPTYELLREELAKSEVDLAGQRAAAAAAMRGIVQMRAQMAMLDQNALTQQDLQRDIKANESNYLLYLGKREQERTSNALDQTRIGNVTIAVPPTIPVLPVYSVPIVILFAIGVGLILSIGVAYTVDHFDTSFHRPAEVVDILGIPIVVTIPKKTA
jgi:succinoglycan biosynthesis transport protein ExoP